MTPRFIPAAVILAAALAAACGGGNQNQPAPAAEQPATPVTNPVDPATAGAITGRISLTGTAPAPRPIRMSSDPNCQPAEGQVTETVVARDGHLKNVFVYVKDGLGNLRFPVPATPVVLDQRGCHYTPHVFGIQVGQPMEIVNSDPTLHNVHALAQVNREFNMGQPTQGMKQTYTFSTREVMVPFKCDVHNWMRAFVGVLDHPFFAVSADDGSFALNGLPPGTYTIEAWHESLGTQTQTVTIGAKESKAIAFSFKAS